MDFIIEYNNSMLNGQEIIKEVLKNEATVHIKETNQYSKNKCSKT